jgi:membrane protease YdiL (CAAX protease family)
VNSPNLPPLLADPLPIGRPFNRPRWWIHLLLLGTYPLILGLIGSGGDQKRAPALGSGPRAILLVSLFELLIFAIIFGLAWLSSRANRDQLLLRWPGLLTIPLGIGYSVAIRVFLGIVVAVVAGVLLLSHLMTPDSLKDFFSHNRPDVEALVDVGALRHNPLYFWLSLTLVSFVVGGLREELWRSAFLAGMTALWPARFGSIRGRLLAVTVAAVIFGLGHLVQGPLAVCLTGLLGFCLGAIMVFHRSIWPAVIAHGMFDATSLALLPWVAEQLKSFPGR